MNNRMKPIKLLLCAALLFGGTIACELEETEEERDIRTVDVETVTLEPSTFESFLRQVGTVTSTGDVTVAAEVTGVVAEVLKREGDKVNAGEDVVRLDNRRLTQEVRRLEAATNQSRENYERLNRLFENEQIGSEIEVLNARFTFEQNLSSLESAKIDLENSVIKAPFPGTIENIMAERGAMVSMGAQVFRIVSDEDKKIRLGVPARFANAVDMGDEAEVWFNFDPDKRYFLPVSFIGNTIDSRNRTFRVDINLPSELANIKVEMIANVRLRTEHILDVIRVNEEFLFQKNNRYVVYTAGVNDDGVPVAIENVVELGPSFENYTVISEGLDEGDELITLGSSYLEDGTRINRVDKRSSGFASVNESEREINE
jgi:membrane fusion protein, multidrug efflux system